MSTVFLRAAQLSLTQNDLEDISLYERTERNNVFSTTSSLSPGTQDTSENASLKWNDSSSSSVSTSSATSSRSESNELEEIKTVKTVIDKNVRTDMIITKNVPTDSLHPAPPGEIPSSSLQVCKFPLTLLRIILSYLFPSHLVYICCPIITKITMMIIKGEGNAI